MNRKITKLGSWLLAFALLLSSMLPITASAASGVTMDLTNCHVSWDYTLTDEDGNAFTAAYGVSAEDNPFGGAVSPAVRKMHDYTAKRNGLTGSKADWTYGADYVYCFCIEHGVPLPNNYEYAGSSDPNHGNKYRMLSNEQKDLLALALTYGYPNRVGLQTSKDANACYAATQLIVWQITLGFRTSPTELNDKSYPVSGYSGTMTEQHCRNKYFKAYYDAILADMASHYIRPSFAVNYAGAAPVYEMEYANGKYTLTLTDANGILSKYYVSQSSGVSVSVSGNTLTLTSSKPINDAVTIKLNRQIPVTTMSTGFLIWSVPGKEGANQDMVSGVPGENDPVPSFLKVRTAAGSAKIVKTSEDGKVDGIAFTISGNGVNQTVTTNNRGEIRIDGLRPGVYTVTEQSYDKYEPQEVRRVTVVSGQISTVTFNNKLKRGSLEVIKTSEDHLIEGVKFHLSGTSLSGLPVDEYAVTDSTGKAVFSDVLIGTGYVLSEVDTDVRYVIPEDQTAAVEWNKVTYKSIHNVLKKWNATVTKSDSTTGTPQGDAKLSGAVYGVYKGGQLVDTYVTDGNGQFTTVYYACGDDWTIREITPSEGYLLDSTVYPVGAEPQRYTAEYNSTALDVTEQIAKGNIAIIKHTDDGSTQLETPEAGVEFAVYLKSAGSYDNARDTERDHLICDENGFAQTKDLPYGVYVVHQTEGWEGRELLPDFEVYIAEDGKTYRYLANNRNFESYVKVIKVDAETGKTIPLAGASFRLYDPDGQLITMTYTYPEVTVIDTFTTSADGMLITPEKLPYGKGYSLEEVSAPYGYVLSSERVYFDITADNATEESAVTVVAVTKENTAQKGIIQITKTGEVFATVTESDGVYRPVYAVQMLPGAVYKITAAEDIITPDGTLRYAAGTVVDTVTTTADAPAGSKPLYLGKYAIREITVPYGMVLSSKVRTVELTYAGQLVEVTETAASFYNERQKAAVDLTKIMAQDEIFGITGADEIGCVTFGLYAAEAMTAADGSVIPAGGLLETVTVGADGKAAFATDLPVGSKAYVQEIATGSHYILSDRKYPVVFDYAGESVALVHLAVNDGQPIENELIYGEIHGLKKDEDGKGLGGALIGLFRADCTEFTRENALLTATSAEDGNFSFVRVPYGNWLVREISAPTGFVLTEECFPVTVHENGAVIEVEIENRPIRGTVALSKVDKDYPENKLEGAVFEVYRDSNGNKEFDAEDELLGTMDELGRGEYAMSELRYGGYFLKEKAAPEGFYPDENAYYFEITADGETVTVENEAGKGFINAAQVGSLRIIKTSSDGKLAGFSFRITSANGYDQVFKTDENGVILIEGLRVGDYTVSEETDGVSAGYILPADKTASVFEGAVTKVEMGDRYGRVLFLKDYAAYLRDDILSELSGIDRPMILSIDVVPIPMDEAIRDGESRLLGVERNIVDFLRKQQQNNNFSGTIPYDMEKQRAEMKEFLDDLTSRDQRMLLGMVTLVHTADSKQQLDADTDYILTSATQRMCQMATLRFQQMDGLNTALPIGVRKIDILRTFTSEALAALMPFRVQEIMEPGGIYYGENAISGNLLLCNRANLLNQSTIITGVPGSGKSFSAKELIVFLALATKDDILICDPEREYYALGQALGGEVIRIAAGSPDHINAMDMVEGYGDGGNPVVDKSEFILSLFEQLDRGGIGPLQKSIIDRCVDAVYAAYKRGGPVPTLRVLREKLLAQPEEEARDLALALELFTTGSLDAFAHETNVDTQNRIVIYDIMDLGRQLKTMGLLIITDAMLNRVTENWRKGKRTHLFIDEFHVVFQNPYSADFFDSAWRRFRKRGAYPTAITQNVEYLLDSVQASTMLSNSEMLILLNQAPSDREKLAALLNISPEQTGYITNAPAGCGLLRYGGALVPFKNQFPKDTELYRLMTTKPDESIIVGGNTK